MINKKRVLVAVFFLLIVSMMFAWDWEVKYEASELPQNAVPTWSIYNFNNPNPRTYEYINNNILIHPTYGWGKVFYQSIPSNASITYLIRAKLDYGHGLSMKAATSARGIYLEISANNLSERESDTDYTFDGTIFHDYWITVNNVEAKLYLDGNLIFTVTTFTT